MFVVYMYVFGRSPVLNTLLQVIVLFQQQDGVDVCLYCIYVQEYGDDCPGPNK